MEVRDFIIMKVDLSGGCNLISNRSETKTVERQSKRLNLDNVALTRKRQQCSQIGRVGAVAHKHN